MNLSNIEKQSNLIKPSKRRGRGIGSGKGGHATGTGNKGQKARKGRKPWLGFEGGQVPLFKRLPQIRGFIRPNTTKPLAVGLNRLNIFEEGTEVSPVVLYQSGVITKISDGGVKLLADGKLTRKLKLKGFTFSKGAQEIVEKSGSEIIG